MMLAPLFANELTRAMQPQPSTDLSMKDEQMVERANLAMYDILDAIDQNGDIDTWFDSLSDSEKVAWRPLINKMEELILINEEENNF
mgnify:CR=1 FL=1